MLVCARIELSFPSFKTEFTWYWLSLVVVKMIWSTFIELLILFIITASYEVLVQYVDLVVYYFCILLIRRYKRVLTSGRLCWSVCRPGYMQERDRYLQLYM